VCLSVGECVSRSPCLSFSPSVCVCVCVAREDVEDCANFRGVDGLCFDYHSVSLSFFDFISFLFKMFFMKLTHIQVLIKKIHEARIKCFFEVVVLKAEALFCLLYYMFKYSYNKIFWGPRKFCENDRKCWQVGKKERKKICLACIYIYFALFCSAFIELYVNCYFLCASLL